MAMLAVCGRDDFILEEQKVVVVVVDFQTRIFVI
jgi:hypothetical protein